ncbi:Myosin-binding protein 2 [Linum perenne]
MGGVREVHTWNLAGLAAAFVDLAITYSLLCVSAFAYLPSKLLSGLGIGFPCPCCGSLGFRNSSSDICLYRLLISWPIKKIVSVQELVKSRFPFDLICCNDYDCGGARGGNEGFELEKEGNDGIGYGDGKGRKTVSQKQLKTVEKRRRRAAAGIAYRRHSSGRGGGGRIGERSSVELVSGAEDDHHPLGTGSATSAIFNPVESCGKGNCIGEASSSSIEKSVCIVEDGMTDSVVNYMNTIRNLEQALEEEKAARTLLYQELEKERAASASAADEAMAMILRLQEEKASLKMELRQSQRMVEEKFAYDEVEMNMLHEILIRREREIHFLEKEVEEFQQMSSPTNGDGDHYSLARSPLSPVPWNDDEIRSAYEDEIEIRAHLSSICERTSRSPLPGGERMSKHKDLRFDLTPIPEEFPQQKEELPEDGAVQLEGNGENGNQGDSDMFSSAADTELTVYDVHVIDDDAVHNNHTREKRISSSSVDHSGTWKGIDLESPSTIDSDRSTFDPEVGWLQERLRIVQQERENLTFSAENREKFSTQLKVMEEIVNQLRAIQHHKEPRSLNE